MPRSIDTHKIDCKCPACRKKTGHLKKTLNIRVEPELEAWMRQEATRRGKTMTEIIETGIRLQQQR